MPMATAMVTATATAMPTATATAMVTAFKILKGKPMPDKICIAEIREQ